MVARAMDCSIVWFIGRDSALEVLNTAKHVAGLMHSALRPALASKARDLPHLAPTVRFHGTARQAVGWELVQFRTRVRIDLQTPIRAISVLLGRARIFRDATQDLFAMEISRPNALLGAHAVMANSARVTPSDWRPS